MREYFKVNFHQPIYSLADCSVKPSRPSPFRVAFASLDGTPQSAFFNKPLTLKTLNFWVLGLI